MSFWFLISLRATWDCFTDLVTNYSENRRYRVPKRGSVHNTESKTQVQGISQHLASLCVTSKPAAIVLPGHLRPRLISTPTESKVAS